MAAPRGRLFGRRYRSNASVWNSTQRRRIGLNIDWFFTTAISSDQPEQFGALHLFNFSLEYNEFTNLHTLNIAIRCHDNLLEGSMKRLTNDMQGVFDPQAWIEEGDGLFASARTIRAIWALYRRNLKHQNENATKRIKINWSKLQGMPRASMLLLAYSIEMYLKAGLAKACMGCSEEFFNHLSRRKYGHRLKSLAREIELPFVEMCSGDLEILSEMITKTARYPLDPEDGVSYSQLVNARTRSIWDSSSFRKNSTLAKNIRAFVSNIDRDSSNPAWFTGYRIDQTGYFASRIGGGLQPRLTVRYSDEMKQAERADLAGLKDLLDANGMHRVTSLWSIYTFTEDSGYPYRR